MSVTFAHATAAAARAWCSHELAAAWAASREELARLILELDEPFFNFTGEDTMNDNQTQTFIEGARESLRFDFTTRGMTAEQFATAWPKLEQVLRSELGGNGTTFADWKAAQNEEAARE